MKKYVAIALCAILIASGLISYNVYAELSSNPEELTKLKQEFEAADKELQTIKDSGVSEHTKSEA